MANGRLIPSGRSPIRIIAQIELPIAVSAIMTSVAVVPAYRFCDGIAGICSGVVVTIDIDWLSLHDRTQEATGDHREPEKGA